MEKSDIVYICSPLSAPTKEGIRQNMEKAADYARLVSNIFGCRAIAPHSFLPEYLDDDIPEEREIGLAFGLSLLRLSKAVIVCGDRISSGMRGEIRTAGDLHIPVYALTGQEGGNTFAKITQEERINEMQVCKGNFS
ncbi:MAG: nucleoside 2-deoxyribosyltransferase [Lachnospiraceae bacterium]|nr:nucleoside 2-deoxyribosyltransferase [Butyrivibrio sp.]MCM1412203.1 nucleoside 2-deoxyribosyltransferase [Lachnospiraceae bacterium]